MKIIHYLFWPLVLILSLNLEASSNGVIAYIPPLELSISCFGIANNNFVLPDKINVLVWNIKKGQEPFFKQDFQQLSKNKDLILIQESFLDDNMTNLFLNAKSLKWDNAISYHMRPKNYVPTGVSTASTTNSNNISIIRTEQTESLLGTPKITLITKYPIMGNDYSLMVVNVHAINFVRYTTFEKEIYRIFDHIKLHKGPMLLAGDFNTWSNKRLHLLKKITTKLELNKIDFPIKSRSIKFGKFFDHAYIRNMKTIAVENLNHIRSSDHLPLSFTLQFQNLTTQL